MKSIFRRKRVASPETGKTHFDRLYLFRCRWFGILLHRLRRPDHDRDMHDHPWSFLSIVLKGGYTEVVPGECDLQRMWIDGRLVGVKEITDGFRFVPDRVRMIDFFNFKRATRSDPHRISYVAPGTLTLVFHGPKRRDWGFHTERGWIPHRRYLGLPTLRRNERTGRYESIA